MNKSEMRWNLIQHFHPNEECGWPIRVNAKTIKLIKNEFPYLEVFWSNFEGQRVRMNGKMTIEHQLIYQTEMHQIYRDLYDDLRGALDNLAESLP